MLFEVRDESRIDRHDRGWIMVKYYIILELEFAFHLTVEITRFDSLFFLPGFLSFGESYTDLDEVSFAIYLHRDDRS